MAEPFLGEIRMFGFYWAPKNWALCNGQFMPINQNQALFSLLGTTFGGNGQTTFQLPDFRDRVPMHAANLFFTLGQKGGAETHTLSINEIPTHTHVLQAVNAEGTTAVPSNTVALANSKNYEMYRPPSSFTTLHPSSISSVGGSQPHTNMQPFLTINFCIALIGLFPTQN